MVSTDGVHDDLVLAEALCEVEPEEGMRSFNALVDGLADVVEECAALRERDIETEFTGHEAGEVGDLQTVRQEVLAVAGAVLHLADVLDELEMSAVEACLKEGVLP